MCEDLNPLASCDQKGQAKLGQSSIFYWEYTNHYRVCKLQKILNHNETIDQNSSLTWKFYQWRIYL